MWLSIEFKLSGLEGQLAVIRGLHFLAGIGFICRQTENGLH